jgi:hypothetical protein
MSNNSIPSPFSIFTDIDGQPLEAGYVWIGTANLDPQTNPISVYWDAALTILAPQPIRTLAGYPSRNGTPANLYVSSDYSIRVMNRNGSTIFTSSAGNTMSSAFVTFIQNKTGAVERSSLSKMRESISLLDFGADPTGAANSTTAWNNFQASSAGRKLIPAGTYLINSANRVYPKDVIEDDIQLFPPGFVGTETRGIENSFFQDKAACRMGMSDTVPTDDNGAGASLPSTNWWGDLANVGIASFAANRNGAAYGTYSSCFGHDSVSYGVAGIAGGAGSAAGSPSTGAGGYCSIAVGKNVWAAGDKSASFCEESRSLGRADFTAGYYAQTGASGIGKVALGYRAFAGNTTGVDGTVAIGNNVVSNNGAIIIGRGINDGSQLNSSFANEIAFGSNVLKPTLGILPGDGTVSGVGSIYSRAPITMIGPVDATPDLTLGRITSVTNNSGAGGSSIMTFGIRVTGTLTDVCAVDYSIGGVPSFIPVTDANVRLGAASRRWEVVYASTGTINTSDARQKQQIKELSDRERAVATRLKSLIKTFKWNDAVDKKGDKARIHVGVIAQDVKAAFEAEGLVAEDYAILCYDKWEGQEEVRDEDGNLITAAYSGGDRYGVRYDQLLAFIIAAI